MRYIMEVKDEFSPDVPPPGGRAMRQGPSTQIQLRVAEWPGNLFRLWLPEQIGELWSNWSAAGAHQDFAPTTDGGWLWQYDSHPAADIQVELFPREQSLMVEARITNRSGEALPNVRVNHCFMLSQAPDFACHDFSRIFIRSAGRWQTLASLKPRADYPHYFGLGARTRRGIFPWEAELSQLHEALEADHALIVCVSKDGQRAVGTASEGFRFVFHNRANPERYCLHSVPEPAPPLASGDAVTFRQSFYFVAGGLSECVAAFENDMKAGEQHFD